MDLAELSLTVAAMPWIFAFRVLTSPELDRMLDSPSLRRYHTSCPFIWRHSNTHDYFPSCGFSVIFLDVTKKRGT
jgi:hypothetical protein